MFFFLSGFLPQTLKIHRAAGEGRGPSFIPLYHFHPLTNIETFICNFACEMNITYFYSHACVYHQTVWHVDIYLDILKSKLITALYYVIFWNKNFCHYQYCLDAHNEILNTTLNNTVSNFCTQWGTKTFKKDYVA